MCNLSSLLDYFLDCRIAVVGDLMLDEYVWGHIERISPEAPVPILNVVSRSATLGGAGNVVANLLSLGAQVSVFGVVGPDETGRKILDLLAACGADMRGVLTDSLRRSTRKSRLMSVERSQQVFRLDEESTEPLSGKIEHQLIDQIAAMASDVRTVVCSDYLKGALSGRVLASTFEVARKRDVRSIVAPKDSDPQKYRGANIVMANLRELMQLSAARGSASTLDDAARTLAATLALEGLVVTRGSEGMSVFQKSTEGSQRVDISTTARTVFDVTGAGDTAIATLSVALASGADLESAARLANITAGVKVGKRGTSTVSLEEIRSALASHTTN